MRRKNYAGLGREPPVVLVKWYDFTRWILEKVDSFPKNQRFIFGTRLADRELFLGLEDARWCLDYNHYRPHSSLGYIPPAEFAARWPTVAEGPAEA